MPDCDLTNPAFTDEDKAREVIEASRWPNDVVCPHCGSLDKVSKLGGKSMGPGWYHCNACRDKFTVRTGTLYERSHIPLHKWLLATHLLTSSKKGISAHQLFRMLGFGSYRTAWFMAHRIREGMRDTSLTPMGGAGKTVEVDETVFGKQEGAPKDASFKGTNFRNVALTLVERGGSARSFHVGGTTIATLKPIIRANIERETAIMTDQATWYGEIGAEFASHDTVNHAQEEYARREGDKLVSTNSVEGYYSVFKRGMRGTYQHCKEKHLHRYLAEFDFRYSNRSALGIEDGERAAKALRGIEGKRLTYRISH
jgi:transposase-like protein